MKSRVVFSRQSDDWSTPKDLFKTLDAEFHFVLDAAADGSNTLCDEYLDDALGVSWDHGGTVFCNPPYSNVSAFVAKAAAEAKRAGITVVMLIPSRTDTRWYHAHIWDKARHRPRPGVQVRFLQGRLKFGDSTNSAPFPSIVVVFSPMRRSTDR